MKNLKISIIALICFTVLTIISTAVAYAILPLKTQGEDGKLESQNIYNQLNLNKLNATTYEDWKETLEKTKKANNITNTSRDKVNELYNTGYSLAEIEKAEKLSILSGKDIDDILNLKYKLKNNALASTGRSWEDIESELKIDINERFDKLKIPEDKVKKLKDKKITDDQIIQAGILSQNYGKDIDEIITEMKSGKKYDQLDKQYWEERKLEHMKKDKNIELAQEELENNIEDELTEDEIKLSSDYGINKIIEIGYAKSLVEKYKTTFKHVLELRSKEENWSTVIRVLKEEMK